jgi:CheY-like chemotaxis protein
VYIPVAGADAQRPATTDTPAQQTGNGERVLVVDDEAFILETAAEALENAGYRPCTAGGAEEALQMADAQPVDVVVTDLRMPHVNGFELIRTLRERYPMLPIIAASGMADGRTDEALEAGAQAFLAKPFTAEKLHATLQDVLQSHAESKPSAP